ncbi:S8 family peptidase [Tissierella praeacuta]|uniref:S8 family peptidase n=1 Tax=Tissierella praeacuta TaxID=43131 RepID=UPI003DA25C0B
MNTYVKENTREFELSGINYWHKKGYTGNGVKIANMESCNIDAWYLKSQPKDPFNHRRNKLDNAHGNQTINVLSQVAPDADFYILPTSGSYGNEYAKGDFPEKAIPFMISEGIHLVNASLIGINNDTLNKIIKNAQENGVTFVSSAGNESDKGTSGYVNSGLWISVGAVHMNKKGDINLASYSSIGEAVDFVQFSGIYVNDVRPSYKDRTIYVTGTSFSSPILCGMLALVQQLFIEKTGQPLSQTKLYEFILDNTIDLGEMGKDVEYGHGLFILPNPENIDINKYMDKAINKPIDDNKESDNMEFKDINKTDWFYNAIKWATEQGIVNGYKDGTFRPNQPMTRAEYCQVEYNKIHKK